MSLFRPESLRNQDRLHGDVNLAPPVSWQVVSILIASFFIVAGFFISTAHYARISQVAGVVESDRGIIQPVAGVAGTVAQVLITEGQHVRRGQPLIVVDHATSAAGGTLEAIRAHAAAAGSAAIEARRPTAERSSQARIAAIRDEIDAANSDERELRDQIAYQRKLISAARVDLDRAREIAKNGFVSQHEVLQREQTLIERQQALSRLQQSLATARAAQSSGLERVAEEQADFGSALRQVDQEQAALTGAAADPTSQPQTVIKATADGLVAILQVTPGQAIAAGQQTMTILPDGGRLRVRLNVPPGAAALIAPGQTARIAVDAFPYQTYGTLPGRITRVSETTIKMGKEASFVAFADLGTNSVRAYGVLRPVRPGMTVVARIRTMDRTLAQWLLDPLYAVARR